jgi:ubiquinone/menaquinone biosynthesis C-methylase UbiE
MDSFYHRRIMPHLVNCLCSMAPVTEQRRRIVPEAEGIVLEVGIGEGPNLPFYDRSRVRQVIGVDPAGDQMNQCERRFRAASLPFQVIAASAEAMPVEDRSIDTVLLTYSACTIPNVAGALAEMRRVLKPGGRLLFCEHGRSHDQPVARWQDRLNRVWPSLAGGCNINRDPILLLDEAGFRVRTLETFYLGRMPKALGFHYVGMAVAA